MVAGCGLWGCNEQQTGQHQARRGGQLGVETIVEDGGRAGELRCVSTLVEPGRQVDEEDDREAEQTEGEDGPAQPPPPGAQHDAGKRGGEQRHAKQQVEVGLAGRLRANRRRAGRRETRVAGLSDLDGSIVDELRDRQAGGGGDDDGADRPFGRQRGAGASHRARHLHECTAHPHFELREKAEEQDDRRAQAPCPPAQPAVRRRPESHREAPQAPRLWNRPRPQGPPQTGEPRPGALQLAIGHSVGLSGGRDSQAERRLDATSRRCYHRPATRLLS